MEANSWTDNEKYGIEAKPSDSSQSEIKTLRYLWYSIEDEHLRQMLQALLIDRFELKFHRDIKTGTVYVLRTKRKSSLQSLGQTFTSTLQYWIKRD